MQNICFPLTALKGWRQTTEFDASRHSYPLQGDEKGNDTAEPGNADLFVEPMREQICTKMLNIDYVSK